MVKVNDRMILVKRKREREKEQEMRKKGDELNFKKHLFNTRLPLDCTTVRSERLLEMSESSHIKLELLEQKFGN